jgi:hypothetical protein
MFASHLHSTLQLDFHQRVSISCLGSIDDIVVMNPPFGTPEEGCQHGFSFNSTNDVLGFLFYISFLNCNNMSGFYFFFFTCQIPSQSLYSLLDKVKNKHCLYQALWYNFILPFLLNGRKIIYIVKCPYFFIYSMLILGVEIKA